MCAGVLRPLQESFQIGLETGLIEFACVNTNIYCIHSFLCGRPLERVEEETRAYSAMYRQFKQETNYNYNEVFRQSMLNFMGRSADPVRLVGEAYDEERMIAQNREHGDKTGAFFIHFQKLLLCYHFRHFAEARAHARSARKLLDAVLAKFEIPNLRFYEALTALAIAEQAPTAARWRLLLRARLDMMRLKYWARFSPANYRHKYDLCAAEYARVIGNENAARLAYDRAITGASQNEFIHEEALAFELAGRFYAATDRPVLAEFHLKAAYNAYREWGAAAKHRDLVQHFPKYLTQKGESLSTLAGGEGGLDLTCSALASLNLLHVLMTDRECRHFMLVCAYRENEVSAAHPFIRAVDDIRETGMTPETIRIGNLTEDDLGAMLADALDSTRAAVAPLAALTHDKTQGNAFFATEFLKSLAAERLLAFDPATTRWQWDAGLIAQKNIAENVVELMANKVRRLDPAVQETLRLASCIGSRFDLETLCSCIAVTRRTKRACSKFPSARAFSASSTARTTNSATIAFSRPFIR